LTGQAHPRVRIINSARANDRTGGPDCSGAARRDGRLMHSHGFTQLELHDHVTLVGSEESLDEVRLRFQA